MSGHTAYYVRRTPKFTHLQDTGNSMNVMPVWIELEHNLILFYFLYDLLDEAEFTWYAIDALNFQSTRVYL